VRTLLRQVDHRQLTLIDLLDRILDKGVVINGDVTVTLAGVDLLSLKINLVIASLETAKRYGIELPWEKWARERAELEESKGKQKDERKKENGSSGRRNRGLVEGPTGLFMHNPVANSRIENTNKTNSVPDKQGEEKK
jgi:hypothetical protein